MVRPWPRREGRFGCRLAGWLWLRDGKQLRRDGPIEQYRANPNDALDVEVAAICNGLGVALERIDAPLPRGVRLEEGPGKDNRAQNEIGGRNVMCRLLELHRPAGGAGARAGTKAKRSW